MAGEEDSGVRRGPGAVIDLQRTQQVSEGLLHEWRKLRTAFRFFEEGDGIVELTARLRERSNVAIVGSERFELRRQTQKVVGKPPLARSRFDRSQRSAGAPVANEPREWNAVAEWTGISRLPLESIEGGAPGRRISAEQRVGVLDDGGELRIRATL